MIDHSEDFITKTYVNFKSRIPYASYNAFTEEYQ